ncbi:MAG: hypothetical protein HY840_07325 [Bacteroidetes bacterium]|nr:hypothetical protein [Bacteroidota bacterium]
MKSSLLTFLLPAFLLFIFTSGTSCGSEKQKQQQAEVKIDSVKKDSVKVVPKQTISYDRKYNDIARFIAGINQTPGSSLTGLEKKESWLKFQKSIDSSWKKLEAKRLKPMRDWAQTELAAANSSGSDVFYPFGGPDFLNVFTFFPNSRNYTIIGLEPPGEIPSDFTKNSDQELEKYFDDVHVSLSTIFKGNYFITKRMINELKFSELKGTLPLLLLFAERTGNTITDLKYLSMNADSSLSEFPLNVSNEQKEKISGVDISFFTATDSSTLRHCYYFRVNLQDNYFKNNFVYQHYLNNQTPVVTYLKSASYLMHYPTFSMIRKIILHNSDYLLQDDSGIAFKYFEKKVWNFKFYGKYIKPTHDFSWIEQNDLQAIYATDTTIRPLPFALGYNWYRDGVSMLLAVKKQISSAQPAAVENKK